MPRIGTSGTSGVRNGPRQVRLLAAQHDDAAADDDERQQGADRHQFAQQADREHARDHRGHQAGDDGGDVRRPELRVHLAEHRREQAVARHGEEDARLAHEHHQHHRGEAGDGADVDEEAEPRERRPGLLDGDEHRVRHVELGVVRQAGHDQRHEDVEHRADGQRAEDADRQVALRVLGLLRRGGDRVEPDVGEEDHRRAADDAAPAEVPELTGVGRDERLPVGAC